MSIASRPLPRVPGLIAAALAALLTGACASTHMPRDYESRLPERASAPPPLVIYPARGQSEALQRRDRYECYRWATAQSGYDPAQSLARRPRPAPRVVPDPPDGAGTATGVVAGAVLGAAMSNSRHSAEGAAIGAVIGGLVGAAADSERRAEAARVQGDLTRQATRSELLEGPARAYQRAFGACLEGRGYSLR